MIVTTLGLLEWLANQTGNKVGRYQGKNTDGSENPDIVFITFCRDGGLGVIGHNWKLN